MEDKSKSPWGLILQTMRSEGAKNNPLQPTIGEVTSVIPLTVSAYGTTIEADQSYMNTTFTFEKISIGDKVVVIPANNGFIIACKVKSTDVGLENDSSNQHLIDVLNELRNMFEEEKVTTEEGLEEIIQKQSMFEQSIDGFKMYVSKTYITNDEIIEQYAKFELSAEQIKTEVVKKINDVDKKATTAIQTAEGFNQTITQELKDNYYKKLEIDTKIDGVEYKFTQSGGYNLLPNSNPKNNNYAGWSIEGACNWYLGTDFWIGLQAQSGDECFAYSPRVDITKSGWYSISGHINAEPGIKGADVFIIGSRNDNFNYDYVHQVINIPSGTGDTYFTSTFEIPDDIKSLTIRVDNNGRMDPNNGNFTVCFFREFMLTIGKDNFLSWTDTHDSIHSGITTIDKYGVTVSMQDGEGNQGKTNIAYDGLTILDSNGIKKAWFGDGDSAFIDKISTNKIVEPTLIKWARDMPAHLYVNPTATGDGTGRNQQNMASSVNNALEWVRREFGCYLYDNTIEIWVNPGDYYYNMQIKGWLGTGRIFVHLAKYVGHRDGISIEDNTCPIYILGGDTPYEWANSETYLFGTVENTIYVKCSNVDIAGINFKKDGWSGHQGVWDNYSRVPIKIQFGANVCVSRCDMTGYYYGGSCGDSSKLTLIDIRGHVYCQALVNYGGIVILGGHQPITNQGVYNYYFGHTIHAGDIGPHNSWFDPKPDAPQPPPPPPPTDNWQWTENTWWASSLWTTPEGTGGATSGKSGNTGQGSWGTLKAHRGFMSFDGVNGWCHGGRNFTAYLTLHRVNTNHGIAGATPVPKFVDINGNSWSSGIGFARNDTKTIQLPWEVAKILIEGHSNTIQMWAGKNSNDYSFYDNVSIRVVCEKNFI